MVWGFALPDRPLEDLEKGQGRSLANTAGGRQARLKEY